ncbi:GDSL-type esterase/lipase family protein [Bacillus sp. JJ1609]|uniref:GDSL-type esterase/lipase family protein n=1 Tax=Bacillus sp. JJ1609 TaxID=3122977 RepID=UPI0030009E6C
MNNTKIRILSVIILTVVIYIMILQSEHYLSEDLNVYEKIEVGDPFNYLIIGDSIGRGAGAERKELRWFNQLEVLINDYSGSRAMRHLVVQSGATAFEGLYQLQSSPKLQNMDLIFIVFGENDRKFMEPEEFTFFYEKLIRNAKELNKDAEIITIIESPLKQEPFADAIKRISVHYGAKCLDMRIPFKESGMLTEHLTSDMVHPNGNGYRLYANSVFELIKENIRNEADIAVYPKSLTKNDFFFLAEKADIAVNNGFIADVGSYVSRKPGDYLEYEFDGPILGVNVIRSEVGGMMNVYIDGEYVRTLSTWWPFARERHLYIASGLEDGHHSVRFEAIEDVSTKNTSQNSLLQIISIIVAKEKES